MNSIFKKLRLRSVLLVVAVVYFAINLITAQSELMTKKREYQSLIEQKERIVLEVRETNVLLEESDTATYIENVAREKLGYAYPGEKVFIDIQSDN